MFGTLGGQELLLILVLALIVFGPRKLPEIGKSIGRMMAEFRKASNDFKRTIEEEVESEKYRSPEPSRQIADAGAGQTASAQPAVTEERSGSAPSDDASTNAPTVVAPEATTVSREEAPPPIEPK